MARHSYDQYCPVAAALDVVGERWSLLLVRELLLGPRRFGDLLGSLPGLGTSLLSARLRQLEDDGVVARDRLGPPANVPVYRLTESGRGLAPAVVALAEWGRHRLAAEPPADLRPELLGLFVAASAEPGPEPGPEPAECYQFTVDGTPAFHLRPAPGGVRPGPPPDPPAATVHLTTAALAELALRRTPVAELEARGLLQIDAPHPVAERVRGLVP